MHTLIDQALTRFTTVCESWGAGRGKIEKIAPYAYLWHPPQILIKSRKPVALSLQAITHGDEVGGIISLIDLLILIRDGLVQPGISLSFSLGNPEAARVNRRFVEKDLNRSFACKERDSLEAQRAAELEHLFKQTDYFLDIHQTIEPSNRGFFIFPYTAEGLEFAAASHPDVPVVTHWGKSFSMDGMCTDEFVNFSGGTGITVELGQKGFDPYHGALGLQTLLGAMRYVQQKLSGEYETAPLASPLYTWKAIEAYEDGMQLDEGLRNFQELKAGQTLGQRAGGPLLARADGMLLFPKYQRDPLAPPPKEIYRIIKPIGTSELGQPGVIGV